MIKLRQYASLIFLVTLCLSGFIIFGKVVSEVLEGESRAIDTNILLALRDPVDTQKLGGPEWLHEAMRDVTALGGTAFLGFLTLATSLYFLMVRKNWLALYVIGAVGTGMIFSRLLKLHFDRPRPDIVPHDSIVFTSSLPSGHALVSAVAYLTLGALLAEMQSQKAPRIYIMGLAVLMTALIGISRVYLGVHWPSDVMAGWLAGDSWALMFWLIARYFRLRAA